VADPVDITGNLEYAEYVLENSLVKEKYQELKRQVGKGGIYDND
jgi:hypothetical protein